MKESDLFFPVKEFFEGMGYTVDGEVGGMDMLMVKDQQYIGVELKNELNFKLVLQGAKRQKEFEQVYIAIWTPKSLFSKSFKDKIYLLNRLGLGLMTVSSKSKRVSIITEPVVHPLKNYRTRNKRKTARVKKEFASRRMKMNTGGVTQQKILTSYREDALLVLDYIYQHGSSKASVIKKEIGIDKSYTIVYQNHYGWFMKEDKGIYGITETGAKAVKENAEIIKNLRESLKDTKLNGHNKE